MSKTKKRVKRKVAKLSSEQIESRRKAFKEKTKGGK